MVPRSWLCLLSTLLGLPAAVPVWGQAVITLSCPSAATPGGNVSCSVNLSLGGGASLDGLTFGAAVTPSGQAPSLTTGQLSFSTTIAGAFINTGGTSNAIGVVWAGLSPVLSGSQALGSLGFSLPTSAANGQTYSVTITGASGLRNNNPVSISAGVPSTLAVGAAAATHFTVSAPASATVGAAINFTVAALDATNSTAAGYSGTVRFTSSDGSAVLPANSTLTNGAGTFSATLKTAGGQTIAATDTLTSSITGTSSTITVTQANQPALVLASSTVQVRAAVGGGPVSGQVALTTSGLSTANFSLSSSTSSGGNWLSVTSGSSTTPATITVMANPSNLAAGSYRGTVTVTSSGASNSPLSLNVELAVSAPQFSPAGVVGGANFSALSISAGGILSLFGTGLSNATGPAISLPLPTTLNNTQVMVNGVAAPLFFVSSGQINFAMPWEVSGQTQVQITIISGGVASLSETVSITPAGPGIFTVNSSGTGQGAIQIANLSPPTFAAPSGSLPGNSARPVIKGEYLTIYCAGLGDVSPRPTTGAAAGSNPPSTTVQTVTVTLGGSVVPSTQYDFAGLAPGFVGLYQVNVQVPPGAPSGGAIPLFLTVGGVPSNTVTIAVQ